MDKPVFQNEKLLKVFVWCILKAYHKETEQLIGKQLVLIKVGQFPTGRLKAGTELSMSPSTAWQYLKILESNKTIDIKSNNKFSTVTVVNWELYQSEIESSDSKADNKSYNKKTAKKQQKNTNKNIENIKNEKNNKEDIYIGGDEEQLLIDESLKADSDKSKKEKYGEFEKVSLTADEFNKLLDKLGQARTKDMIARLDTYKASTGKKYADDYATILNWNRKDIAEGKYKEQGGNKKPKESSNPFIEMMQDELKKEAQKNDKS